MSDRSFLMDEIEEPLINDPDTIFSRLTRRPPCYTRRRFVTRVLLGGVFVLTIMAVASMALFPDLKQRSAASSQAVNSPPRPGAYAPGDGQLMASSTAKALDKAPSATKTTTSYRAIPTLPGDIDKTPPVLPNIHDPLAVNAQEACPGYFASGEVETAFGFTASLILAGTACNVYGTDIANLNLTVEYQSIDRLSVRITPAYIVSSFSGYHV